MGSQYRSAIFYCSNEQHNDAMKSKEQTQKTLQKAIEDGTPLETDKGTFPLTWIDDSDKKKFVAAIGGGGASDYWPSLKVVDTEFLVAVSFDPSTVILS